MSPYDFLIENYRNSDAKKLMSYPITESVTQITNFRLTFIKAQGNFAQLDAKLTHLGLIQHHFGID